MIHNMSSPLEAACPTFGTRGPEASFYHWLALGYVFLFILALSANLRVLFKLVHYSRRRFHDHILLLNLCAADLFVTLVYIPSEIYAHTVGRWHNDGICKSIAALKGLGIYVSSCTIISISLDRYLSIVHPLTVYRSNKRNKLFVIGSWVISTIACLPQLIIFKRLTNEELCLEMCGDTLSEDPLKRLAYNVAVAIFAYIAPLITIFYSYFRILYALHKRSDRRTFRFGKNNNGMRRSCEMSEPNNSVKSSSTTIFHHDRGRIASVKSEVQGEINTHNVEAITRAKLKTLKLTALIVICFILCWTPYYCIVFFLLITDTPNIQENLANLVGNSTITTRIDVSIIDQPPHDDRPLLIVMMLAVSNSVLDPLIYGCYLVPSVKSGCLSGPRSRTQTTTLGRMVVTTPGDKETKLNTIQMNAKNGNHIQRGVAV